MVIATLEVQVLSSTFVFVLDNSGILLYNVCHVTTLTTYSVGARSRWWICFEPLALITAYHRRACSIIRQRKLIASTPGALAERVVPAPWRRSSVGRAKV